MVTAPTRPITTRRTRPTTDPFSQGDCHRFHWSGPRRSVCGLPGSILKNSAGLGIVRLFVRSTLWLSAGKFLPASKLHPGPLYLLIHQFGDASPRRTGMVVNGACYWARHRSHDGDTHASSTRWIKSTNRLLDSLGLDVLMVSDPARCDRGAGSCNSISQIRQPS